MSPTKQAVETTVIYDFDDPIFSKERRYKRLAREHMSIAQFNSTLIKWRVIETATRLKIPTKYEIDYLTKSITGIKDDLSPVYGYLHTIEITFPARFPLETFKAKSVTDIWHPNIKWDGQAKGRICVNNQIFGRGYDLYWLVLRIGEIIQYKNYLAENIPPYPEDIKVADWVLNYAEPKGIVSMKHKISVDNSNLIDPLVTSEEQKKVSVTKKEGGEPNIKIKIIKKNKD